MNLIQENKSETKQLASKISWMKEMDISVATNSDIHIRCF